MNDPEIARRWRRWQRSSNLPWTVARHRSVPAASSLMMSDQPAPPIQVNRAPVLAVWATIVAEALGHPPDTALTLGRYVTGASARIKAKTIGMLDEAMEAAERIAQAEALKPDLTVIVLLGREIPVLLHEDGTHRANEKGKPMAPKGAGRISPAPSATGSRKSAPKWSRWPPPWRRRN